MKKLSLVFVQLLFACSNSDKFLNHGHLSELNDSTPGEVQKIESTPSGDKTQSLDPHKNSSSRPDGSSSPLVPLSPEAKLVCPSLPSRGSINNYVNIITEADLLAIDRKPGQYRLMNDIDLTANYRPITLDQAVFDGNGHAIRGFGSANLGNYPNSGILIGIFGYARLSTIQNLDVFLKGDIDLTGFSSGSVLGLLIGRGDSVIVSNVSTQGGQFRAKGSVGGIIGLVYSYPGCPSEILGSWSDISIKSTCDESGGLVGKMSGGKLSYSYASGDIDGGTGRAGGLVGEFDGILDHSYASGRVTAYCSGGLVGKLVNPSDPSYPYCEVVNSKGLGGVHLPQVNVAAGRVSAGGLIGQVGHLCRIERSYAVGTVTNQLLSSSGIEVGVGGLVGKNDGYLSDVFAKGAVVGGRSSFVGGLVGLNSGTGSIQNSYSVGRVSGNPASGLVGSTGVGGSVSNSYWDITTSLQSTSSGGGTGKTTSQMKNSSTFLTWDFNQIWSMPLSSYPHLLNVP